MVCHGSRLHVCHWGARLGGGVSLNTTELELFNGWNEREMSERVTDFVRRERRLPRYDELVWLQTHAAQVVPAQGGATV